MKQRPSVITHMMGTINSLNDISSMILKRSQNLKKKHSLVKKLFEDDREAEEQIEEMER